MLDSPRTDPVPTNGSEGAVLLAIDGLRVGYGSPTGRVDVVDDVSLTVRRGMVLGLAGESGSGKSTVAHAVLRLLPAGAVVAAGSIRFNGRDVLAMGADELRRFRWRDVAIVPQSALNSLNPTMTVLDHIADTIRAHERATRDETLARAEELIDLVRIPRDRLRSYPHQLSGGMRQRVAIALALTLRPQLVIMDEPTTALDVVVEQEILEQIGELRARLGFAMLFITHDLSRLGRIADEIAVMYAGRVVEQAAAGELLHRAQHPYCRALLASVPHVSTAHVRRDGIAGAPPNPAALPPGCRFHPRCPHALDACRAVEPALLPTARDHLAACHLLTPPR